MLKMGLALGHRPLLRGRFGLWVLMGFAALRALALDPDEKPRNYILTRWDAEDGMPQSMVRHLTQTRDGYLWIGSTQGLSRFDGLTFTNFKSPNTPGLPGNVITAFAETADGSLWIGTSTGLGRYYEGNFTRFTQKEGLKADNVSALCVAPDGSLWIGCSLGITRWAEGKFIQDIDTSPYDLQALQSFFVDRQKAIWGAVGPEVFRYTNGKFTRFSAAQGLTDKTVRTLQEDAEGRILAVTQGGLFRFEGEKFVRFEANLASPRLNNAALDHDGNLWIGSVAGLERYSKGKVELYTDSTGEKLTGIDRIFEDREGCLWLGSNTGLSRLTNRRGRTLTVDEGVLGTSGLAVKEARDGSVWLSSWAGGVARFQNGTIKQYRAGAPMSHESITCIYEAPDGTLWFSNRGSSLDHLVGDTITTYPYPPGVATARYVSAMYTEPDGELLLAIAGRGLFNLRDGKYERVPEAGVLASAVVAAIHRTKEGRLLFATQIGLYERAPDRTFRLVDVPGIEGPLPVRGIFEESDGGLWLATETRGLVHWKGAVAHVYGLREGMIDDNLSSTLTDEFDSIWVTSGRGIARIPRAEFADLDAGKIARLNPMTFGRADGLLNASVSTACAPISARLSDGRLMFATGKGFAVIDPQRLKMNSRPPTLVVEGVVADDRMLAAKPGEAISVPAGTYRLEIRYTALSLVAPQRLRFRYQLQGSDPGWIEAGKERSARYTHLAPGNYTFRVLACNSDGVWNETGATLGFIVRPFFYQTRWFAGLVTVTAGLGIFGFLRARVRIARQRLAALEKLVGERTRELRQAKDMAEAAREEIARERARFKFIFEALPVGVTWMVRGKLSTRVVNPSHAQMSGVPIERRQEIELYRQASHPDDRLLQEGLHRKLEAGEIDHYTLEKRYIHPDGRICWVSQSVWLFADPAIGESQEISTLVDITERKQVELEREKLNRQLLEVSRQAGMAEVATGVLHNVGNVLNSVNVSATLVIDRVRESKATNIGKVAALLAQHKETLSEFLTHDARGQMIPGYLSTLADALAGEREALVEELELLRKNIEHIKNIVGMQQSFARTSHVIEQIAVPDLIEDALRMTNNSLGNDSVQTVRDFQVTPVLGIDRHKVLQILGNLISNARHACNESSRTDKVITLRTSISERGLAIAVVDNGMGIAPENLTRIFNHGFTTRRNGHGFGLHNSAIAAKELGGSLRVESAGVGCGAAFILVLPLTLVAKSDEPNSGVGSSLAMAR